MKTIDSVTKTNDNMKHAYIENILLWMVMFIGFAGLLFLVINYATIIRVKDNMDAISDYGALRISKDGLILDTTQFSNKLNNMKVSAIGTIDATLGVDMNCTTVADSGYQVIFITQTTNTSYKFFNSQLKSKRAVYNESNSNSVTCTLDVTLN